MPIDADGVTRQSYAAPLWDLVTDPEFGESDTALTGYYDTPRPANDNERVYRSVHSSKPYHGYNSTSFKYVDVALPRVSIIDGAYRGQVANDNRVAA